MPVPVGEPLKPDTPAVSKDILPIQQRADLCIVWQRKNGGQGE